MLRNLEDDEFTFYFDDNLDEQVDDNYFLPSSYFPEAKPKKRRKNKADTEKGLVKKKRKSEKTIEEPINDVEEEKEEDEVEMKIEEEEEDKENKLEDLSKLQDNLLEKATGMEFLTLFQTCLN